MKYRIKFSKIDKMRFIGHLDLLKLFQRAIKRADLPIAYSKGFNPHQLIGFAIPLPLGMYGFGEYVDIELKEEMDTECIKNSLNEVMPEALNIISVKKLDTLEKNCAAIVAAAEYEAVFNEKIENFDEKLKEIMSQKELLTEKASKKKFKTIDIKPDIFYVKDVSDENETKIKMLISTGSQRNLKPDLFIQYIYNYLKLEYIPYKIKIKRFDLFKETEDGLKSL